VGLIAFRLIYIFLIFNFFNVPILPVSLAGQPFKVVRVLFQYIFIFSFFKRCACVLLLWQINANKYNLFQRLFLLVAQRSPEII